MRITTEQDAINPNPTFIPAANHAAQWLAERIGGIPQSGIPEALFNVPGTAHILGGAIIAADPSQGVIDAHGHVFGYQNLLITDGSALPANPGVNPSLTITALAEHTIAQVPTTDPPESATHHAPTLGQPADPRALRRARSPRPRERALGRLAGADHAKWISIALSCARPWPALTSGGSSWRIRASTSLSTVSGSRCSSTPYERGGTGAAALLAVAQLLPSATLAPILARRIDRRGPGAALWQGYLAQAITLSAHRRPAARRRPAGRRVAGGDLRRRRADRDATSPGDARAPARELAGRADRRQRSVLLGGERQCPRRRRAGGGLIALGGPGAAVVAFALACVLSTAATAPLARLPLRGDVVPGGAASDTRPALDPAHARAGLGPLLGLLAVQYLVVGLLDVAMVALAIGVLGLGASGAGYLNAAVGAGGLVGSLLAVTLITRRRLTPALVGANLGWGIVVALLGIWPTPLGAFALLAGAGCGRSLVDVSGRTLLMRHSLPSDRARLFGALEGVSMLALAGGSALVPLLEMVGGLRGALIVVGGLLILGVLLAARNLQRLEERDERRMPTSWAVPLTTTASVPDVAVMTPLQ